MLGRRTTQVKKQMNKNGMGCYYEWWSRKDSLRPSFSVLTLPLILYLPCFFPSSLRGWHLSRVLKVRWPAMQGSDWRVFQAEGRTPTLMCALGTCVNTWHAWETATWPVWQEQWVRGACRWPGLTHRLKPDAVGPCRPWYEVSRLPTFPERPPLKCSFQ